MLVIPSHKSKIANRRGLRALFEGGTLPLPALIGRSIQVHRDRVP
jgi:hypothetical protein